MRVLVTGGAGYIGSHTVRLMRRLGHEPIVLDTLEHGHAAAVDGAELIVGSVADRALVRSILEGRRMDGVIHFAALKAAGESVDEPARYFHENTGGTLALLAEIDRAGVRSFVFSSTCAVYGEPERSPIDETAELRPTTPYGESKLLVERALPWYERHRLRTAVLRYFNAAGAEADGSHGEDPTNATNLIPRVIGAGLGHQGPVSIYGADYDTPDGTAVRDYVHVDDLASAHLRALETLLDGGPPVTVNLGTGQGSSVLEVIGAVERVVGRPVPTVVAGRRAGDAPAIWADTRRAATDLGWVAASDLDAIVRSAVAWQASHPTGYSR